MPYGKKREEYPYHIMKYRHNLRVAARHKHDSTRHYKKRHNE